MKNLSLIIFLMISALFGSVGVVVASDLPACPSSGYFHNCFGTHRFSNGDKYVGEWKDGKKQGTSRSFLSHGKVMAQADAG